MTDRVEIELGKNYSEILIEYLSSPELCDFKYIPTWLITANCNWKGKSYWVRKALKQLQKDNKIISYKHRPGMYSWALNNDNSLEK